MIFIWLHPLLCKLLSTEHYFDLMATHFIQPSFVLYQLANSSCIVPAGNHSTCIYHLGLDVDFDGYNYLDDAPPVHLVERVGHWLKILNWKNNLNISSCFQWLCMPSGSLLQIFLSVVVYHVRKLGICGGKINNSKSSDVLTSNSQLTVASSRFFFRKDVRLPQ